jgi:hypothetical protein
MTNFTGVSVTITATATVYATATGGLPIDLTGVLQQAAPAGFDAPNYVQALNPADVMGVTFLQLSTNGFMPAGLVVGTPTYTAVPWESSTNAAAVPGILATCPATIRLFGSGAANHSALGEIADGAVTDTITLIVLIARSGANN